MNVHDITFHSFHLKVWRGVYSSKFIPQPTVEQNFFQNLKWIAGKFETLLELP